MKLNAATTRRRVPPAAYHAGHLAPNLANRFSVRQLGNEANESAALSHAREDALPTLSQHICAVCYALDSNKHDLKDRMMVCLTLAAVAAFAYC